jgi:hypothetical protein
VLGKKLEKLVILLQENGSGKEKSLRIDDVVRTFRDRSMIGIYKCTLQLGF